MIVPMKKVEVLVLQSDRAKALKTMESMRAVHVRNFREPTGQSVERVRSLRRLVRLVFGALPENPEAKPSGMDPAKSIKEIFLLLSERKKLTERLEELRAEERALAPFGDFKPAEIEALKRKGVFITLHRLGPTDELQVPEDAMVIELQRDKLGGAVAVISLDAPFRDAPEYHPPASGLSGLRDEIRRVEDRISRIDQGIGFFSGDRNKVRELLGKVERRLELAEVDAGMHEIDLENMPLVVLRGFIPAFREDDLRREAEWNGWGLVVSDPSEEDDPPTLLKNPAWIKPVKTVFDAVGVLPGYQESDVSGPVLVFLSLFFAMLVGDAGYGLLFLVLTTIGKTKFKKAPPEAFTLLFVMSLCTVVWGALTGTWFGISGLPAPLEQLKLEWLTGQGADQNIMALTFLIGAIHLSLAHILVTLRLFPSPTALAQIGWIAITWGMYFAAMSMVLLKPFPQAAYWLLGTGSVLIVVFTVPPRLIKNQWTEFISMPLSLIGNFVDVVSYVRLFAVGAASFAMADAFNSMATGLGAGGFLAGLGAALVLFFGHTLNILLACMGVLVHGVRLNTLEFAGHMGLKWSGYRYAPFGLSKGMDGK